MASLFDDIEKKKATLGQGNYFSPGRYFVRINDWKEGTTRPPKNRDFYVMETTVRESDNHVKHPIGSEASWMVLLDTDMAAINLKNAIMGVLGSWHDFGTPMERFVPLAENQVTSLLAKKVLTPDDSGFSPLAGTLVEVTGTEIITKAGTPFTQVRFKAWRHADGKERPLPSLTHRERFVQHEEAAPAEPDLPF